MGRVAAQALLDADARVFVCDGDRDPLAAAIAAEPRLQGMHWRPQHQRCHPLHDLQRTHHRKRGTVHQGALRVGFTQVVAGCPAEDVQRITHRALQPAAVHWRCSDRH
jgi:NAD(P)-dependent dehydrogenase (short-subunit alcohol dehydrogenase family)